MKLTLSTTHPVAGARTRVIELKEQDVRQKLSLEEGTRGPKVLHVRHCLRDRW